jgi:hypothetical protein
MKNFAVTLIPVVALLIAGCGPSEEQKKMQADLTNQVAEMANATQASLGKMDDITAQVASAIASMDTLAKRFPKDTVVIAGASNQLKSANERLASVKENVSAWLSNYKSPDPSKMKFDELISDLKKSKDDLTSANGEIEGALSNATSALDGYKSVAANIATKPTKKGK